MVVWKQGNKVLIKDRLSAIRQLVEAVVDQIQICSVEGKAKLFKPMRQGTPAGMLAQHPAIVGYAHRSRSHDLVSQRVGQHAVLMNTCLMGKCIAAHNRLVGRWRR